MVKQRFNLKSGETYASREADLQAKADKIEEMLGHPKTPQPSYQPKGAVRVQTNEQVRTRLSQQHASIQDELKAIEKERAQRQDAQAQSIQKSKTL